MKEQSFPALYHAANAASNEAQATLLFLHKSNTVLLVLAAITALVSTVTSIIAILSALLFSVSLFAYVYGRHQDFEGRWYQARALA